MKTPTHHRIQFGARGVDYRVVSSPTARRLRVRVGPNGIEVIRPKARNSEDVAAFLSRNEHWILNQLRRIEQLRGIWRPDVRGFGEILFRGVPTKVRVVATGTRSRGNRVELVDGEIIVHRGPASRTSVAQSLENWLRRQARCEIQKQLAGLIPCLKQEPRRLYVMGQRTKWGNCSSERNLSFNWRLILAPDFVLQYLVTHEVVHLVIPDHSSKFWLTVQSFCRDTERAKQWLCSCGHKLTADLRVS